jgi:hypothetical protein
MSSVPGRPGGAGIRCLCLCVLARLSFLAVLAKMKTMEISSHRSEGVRGGGRQGCLRLLLQAAILIVLHHLLPSGRQSWSQCALGWLTSLPPPPPVTPCTVTVMSCACSVAQICTNVACYMTWRMSDCTLASADAHLSQPQLRQTP